ncbi:hypothetical protein ACHQM5_021796 [Ranunculus cassubicifolius]
MQTPKGRAGTLEIPQRTSPGTTPRSARQLKAANSETDSPSSQPASRTPKDRSPKVTERKSPRSPVAERKRPSRITELEAQLTQLQENFKKTKEQLNLSESCKGQAQQEAEEAKKQLLSLSAKHDEIQRQLLDISASEEDRLQELRKISQERDKAWESELEAVQKQHSVESSALCSALTEIQRLKLQLESVADDSDAEKTRSEIINLQSELAKTQSMVENLTIELSNCKESESQAQAMVSDTLRQLETARVTVETLRADGIKTMEAYNALSSELEQSKARVDALEELASKLQLDLSTANAIQNHSDGSPHSPEIASDHLNAKLNSLNYELESLQAKYQAEQIQTTMELNSAYELVEQVKSKEMELESELKRTKVHIEELRANLMDKETELQSISEENEGLATKLQASLSTHQRQPELEMEINKTRTEISDLKAFLMDKETELQIISEENQNLKSEIKNRESAFTEIDAIRVAEKEALSEETEKSIKKAERATEQLEAAQVANSEMEAELRRMKVQSDQWRKAAEAAAAVLSSGNNNPKCVDRTGSLDSNYHSATGKIYSPYSEDMDDDSPKKKNMLKKLGGLWKKNQK